MPISGCGKFDHNLPIFGEYVVIFGGYFGWIDVNFFGFGGLFLIDFFAVEFPAVENAVNFPPAAPPFWQWLI